MDIIPDIIPNLPKSQRSGIKQAVHFNEGIDCSGEHSYQVFLANPMKTQGEEISKYFHGGKRRPHSGQWTKRDTNSSLDWRSKYYFPT